MVHFRQCSYFCALFQKSGLGLCTLLDVGAFVEIHSGLTSLREIHRQRVGVGIARSAHMGPLGHPNDDRILAGRPHDDTYGLATPTV